VPHATHHHEAQVTDPETLDGACEGASADFSALGITRQKDAVTYEDIEYRANLNLLREAQRAGVGRFGVISVVQPESFRGLAIMESRERFIAELRAGAMPSTVVRATGFFDGRDLAAASCDALLGGVDEVEVGGPDVLPWNEVAALAFGALGTKSRVTCLPAWLVRVLLAVVRPFHRRSYDVGQFILRGATRDVTAPRTGKHHLRDHYEALARALRSSASDAGDPA
jgi:uncharacterized protein YbjT (DUF2867 family)